MEGKRKRTGCCAGVFGILAVFAGVCVALYAYAHRYDDYRALYYSDAAAPSVNAYVETLYIGETQYTLYLKNGTEGYAGAAVVGTDGQAEKQEVYRLEYLDGRITIHFAQGPVVMEDRVLFFNHHRDADFTLLGHRTYPYDGLLTSIDRHETVFGRYSQESIDSFFLYFYENVVAYFESPPPLDEYMAALAKSHNVNSVVYRHGGGKTRSGMQITFGYDITKRDIFLALKRAPAFRETFSHTGRDGGWEAFYQEQQGIVSTPEGLEVSGWSTGEAGVAFAYEAGALQGTAALPPGHAWQEALGYEFAPEYEFGFTGGRYTLTLCWDAGTDLAPDVYVLDEALNLWVLVEPDALLYPTVVPLERAEAHGNEEAGRGTVSVLACFEPLYDVSVYLVPDAGTEVIYDDPQPVLLAHYAEYDPAEPFVWVVDEHVFYHLSIEYTGGDGCTYLQRYSISGQKYFAGVSRPLESPDWE